MLNQGHKSFLNVLNAEIFNEIFEIPNFKKVVNSNCLLKLDFLLKIVNLIFFLFKKVPEQSK
jgi:hypothetical protein